MVKSRETNAARATGRSIGQFTPLLPAEQKLRRKCRAGEVADIDERRPKSKSQQNSVRAEFLRFLALGGDKQAPMHEKGVQLQGAWIEGNLDFEACKITVPLILDRCKINGELILLDADILGLTLEGSAVDGISGDRLHCHGDLRLSEGFVATGEVLLLGVGVDGDLDCFGGKFQSKPQALTCEWSKIGGNLLLNEEFHANGEVSLEGTRIGGRLDCSNGRFEGPEGDAISCGSVSIDGDVLLKDGFSANGSVSIAGARIGGDLDCENAQLTGGDDGQLWCDGSDIKGDTRLSNGFCASGEISLIGARIAGDLDCGGGRFHGGKNGALTLDRAEVHGDAYLNSGFDARGSVRLVGAQIRGDLDLRGGALEEVNEPALYADWCKIGGSLYLQELKRVNGMISLTSVQVGALVDDMASWQMASAIDIDGFKYERISGGAPLDAERRIAWLSRQVPSRLQQDFRPQPWLQLIRVLREMGHADEARTVAIEQQNRLRSAGKITGVAWLFHGAYGLIYGYGYRPLRLFLSVLAVAVGFAFIYDFAPANSVMIPTERHILEDNKYAGCQANWTNCPALSGKYTVFNPFLYSLDLIIPVINLGQVKDWTVATAKPVGWTIWTLMRLENLFGWVAGLLFVAVVSGLGKRD